MDKTAQMFVARTFQPDDRIALVQISSSSTQQRILRARYFDRHMEDLTTANAERGANVYIAVNPLNGDAHGRTKNDIASVRHVFLDFDADAKARIEAMNKSGRMPRPSEIVYTSPGKAQVLWRVDGFSKDQAEGLMRGLSREYGADTAATDIARVMRLPGFRNRKYPDAPYVGVQRVHSGVSRPEQFPVYTEEQQRAHVRGAERGAPRHGGNTRSERDFAWAAWRLERGADPSDLRARLAEMRPDKPNPRYYAEHTVQNAQRAIESRGR